MVAQAASPRRSAPQGPFGGTIVVGAHEGRGYEHCFNGFLPDGHLAPSERCGHPRQRHGTARRLPRAAPSDARCEARGGAAQSGEVVAAPLSAPAGTPAPNAVTRELYLTKFLPRMAARWSASAPAGADLTWHSY